MKKTEERELEAVSGFVRQQEKKRRKGGFSMIAEANLELFEEGMVREIFLKARRIYLDEEKKYINRNHLRHKIESSIISWYRETSMPAKVYTCYGGIKATTDPMWTVLLEPINEPFFSFSIVPKEVLLEGKGFYPKEVKYSVLGNLKTGEMYFSYYFSYNDHGAYYKKIYYSNEKKYLPLEKRDLKNGNNPIIKIGASNDHLGQRKRREKKIDKKRCREVQLLLSQGEFVKSENPIIVDMINTIEGKIDGYIYHRKGIKNWLAFYLLAKETNHRLFVNGKDIENKKIRNFFKPSAVFLIKEDLL